MIYVKTAAGRQALKERSEAMPKKYHFPFLLFDGTRDHMDVLAVEAKNGFTLVDIDRMVQLGFIALTAPAPAPAPSTPSSLPIPSLPVPSTTTAGLSSAQQAVLFVEAVHRATAMTSKLGLRGFRLNLAIETASNLNDLRALLPQIESAVGAEAVQPLVALLKDAI